MKTLAVVCMVASLLFGCDKSPEVASNEKQSTEFMVMDERTAIGEVPSVFGDNLTPEEKSAIMDEILPAGSSNDSTPEEKFKQLLSDAQAGNPEAQNGLGVMYYTGEAISKTPSGEVLDNDPELAAGWFLRAAEQGFADAQFNLGLMYVNGEGVEKDIAQAVTLFRKAAMQGHVDAQNNLGALYYTGEGVERDIEESIKWFKKAVAQGNADAQANLDAIKAQKQ